MSHGNARLTPAGRLLLVRRVAAGAPGQGNLPDGLVSGHGGQVGDALGRVALERQGMGSSSR